MRRKKRETTVDLILEELPLIFTVIPPWVSIPAAIIGYLTFFFFVSGVLPQLQLVAHVSGFLCSVILLISGLKGWEKRRQRADFLRQNIDIGWLNSLSWQEFEILSQEIFTARGYSVVRTGGSGPDGGIDLILRKGGQTTLVQCKRWKVFKVGVKPIRELYGVMASEGAAQGIFISSGIYTNEALYFTQGKPIQLLDGAQFAEMAKAYQSHFQKAKADQTVLVADTIPTRPGCPLCGAEMVLRKSKNGKTTGQTFWGCSSFPRCRGTLAYNQFIPSRA